MTDKEQIEEMVSIIDKGTNTKCFSRDDEHTKCGDCEVCWTYAISKILYNAGYRKESETAKEIYKNFVQGYFRWDEEDFEESFKEYINKEYGVEIEE